MPLTKTPCGLQVPHEEGDVLRGAGPHVGAESERGVVGDGHGLLDVADRVDRRDGAEGLLLVDPHLGGDAGEHRGPVVPAVPELRGLGAVAAAQGGGTVAYGVVDELLQVGPALFGGEGADVGGLVEGSPTERAFMAAVKRSEKSS